jgi:hypothetical protein
MAAAVPSATAADPSRQQPVILLDVMDTIVSDPFFEHMPRFFNLTFKVSRAVWFKSAAAAAAATAVATVSSCCFSLSLPQRTWLQRQWLMCALPFSAAFLFPCTGAVGC